MLKVHTAKNGKGEIYYYFNQNLLGKITQKEFDKLDMNHSQLVRKLQTIVSISEARRVFKQITQG